MEAIKQLKILNNIYIYMKKKTHKIFEMTYQCFCIDKASEKRRNN